MYINSPLLTFIQENTTITPKQYPELYNLTEAELAQGADKLLDKLYQKTVDRYAELDFGLIERSEGDWNKLPFAKTIEDTISFMRSLANASGLRSYPRELTEIENAVSAISNNADEFKYAFKAKVDIVKILYTSIVMSIVEATSLIMDSWLKYVKTADGTYKFELAVEQMKEFNKRGAVCMQTLVDFNQAVSKGGLNKLFKSANSSEFVGTAIAVLLATVTAVSVFVVIMRNAVYYYYAARVSVADYLNYQARIIELNASRLAYSSEFDKKKRAEIVKKQEAAVKTLKDLSAKIDVTSRVAKDKSHELMVADKEKIESISNIGVLI